MTSLVAIDLEWNTASRGLKVDPDLASRMMFEIIEIGAVRLDQGMRVKDRFATPVRPVLYTKLQHHIARVTNRTSQSLEEGLTFPKAWRSFLDFAGHDLVLASWGTSDPEVLISNLQFHEIKPQPAFRALNIQAVFSALAEGTSRGNQRSIEYALDFLRLDKDLPFHEALSDAVYAGRILAETLRPELEAGKDPEKLLKPFIYDPFLVSQSEERLEIEKDTDVPAYLNRRTYRCPACQNPLTGDFMEINPGKSWFAKGHCPDHGDIELLVKRARRTRTPQLQVRCRIPQGPLVVPKPPPEKERVVWTDPKAE